PGSAVEAGPDPCRPGPVPRIAALHVRGVHQRRGGSRGGVAEDAMSEPPAGGKMSKLDLTPLSRAVARLDEGLARHQQSPNDEQLRDGLIQRFEFTYEVCHKLLKRYLESVSPTPGEYDEAD